METLRSYLATLTPAAQADYALRAGTTIGYLRKALSAHQRFKGALVSRLFLESNGAVSLADMRADTWPRTWNLCDEGGRVIGYTALLVPLESWKGGLLAEVADATA